MESGPQITDYSAATRLEMLRNQDKFTNYYKYWHTWSKVCLLSLASPQDQMSSRGPVGFCHVYNTADPLSRKRFSVTYLYTQ